MLNKIILCLVLVLGIFMSMTMVSAVRYDVADLGTLEGSTYAYGLNNEGQVVGSSYYNGRSHAFSWQNGIITAIDNYRASSSAKSINKRGHVAGQDWSNGQSVNAAVWYLENGKWNFHLLGTLGGDWSVAKSINDRGLVTGDSITINNARRAFVWDRKNGMIDIGTLGGRVEQQSYGNDINNRGQVVGKSEIDERDLLGNYITHAFFSYNLNGERVMIDLGTLGGARSEAFALNDNWMGVGSSDTSRGGRHASLWERDENNEVVITDLGVLVDGQLSGANDINNRGQVVGFGRIDSSTVHASLWEKGDNWIITDLNDLIDGNSGWVLNYAYSINDKGYIAGAGKLNGQERGFLLIPRN